jgi:hypothetical protein
VSAQVAAVAVNTGIHGVGDVAIVRATVGRASRLIGIGTSASSKASRANTGGSVVRAEASGVGAEAGVVVRAVSSTVITVTVDTRIDLVANIAVMGAMVGGATRLVGAGTSASG